MKTIEVTLVGSQAHLLLNAAFKAADEAGLTYALLADGKANPTDKLTLFVDASDTVHSVVLNRDGTWCLKTHACVGA